MSNKGDDLFHVQNLFALCHKNSTKLLEDGREKEEFKKDQKEFNRRLLGFAKAVADRQKELCAEKANRDIAHFIEEAPYPEIIKEIET